MIISLLLSFSIHWKTLAKSPAISKAVIARSFSQTKNSGQFGGGNPHDPKDIYFEKGLSLTPVQKKENEEQFDEEDAMRINYNLQDMQSVYLLGRQFYNKWKDAQKISDDQQFILLLGGQYYAEGAIYYGHINEAIKAFDWVKSKGVNDHTGSYEVLTAIHDLNNGREDLALQYLKTIDPKKNPFMQSSYKKYAPSLETELGIRATLLAILAQTIEIPGNSEVSELYKLLPDNPLAIFLESSDVGMTGNSELQYELLEKEYKITKDPDLYQSLVIVKKGIDEKAKNLPDKPADKTGP